MAEFINNLIFYVNGRKIIETNPNPEWTLIYYLRTKLILCGTKEACGDGGCGSCTVMLSRKCNERIVNLAVNACLVPLCSVHGSAIVTVEGIGNVNNLHPIQERLSKSHGVQCGYCSPGFVMSTYTLLRNNPNPTEKQLEYALRGNLCRCTGYRPIFDGLRTFCGSSNCCKNQNGFDNQTEKIATSLCDESSFKPYDPTQEPLFPAELMMDTCSESKSLRFTNEALTFHRPRTLEQVLSLKKAHPEALFISGGTSKCLRQKIHLNVNPNLVLIQISSSIKELSRIEIVDNHLVVGAAVTFSQLLDYATQHEDFATGNLFHALSELLTKIGDLQLRNVATVGGAIVCKNEASDFITFLVAAQASVSLFACDKASRIQLVSQLFNKSGGIALDLSQILTCVKIPLTTKDEYLWFTKRSNRKYGDSAISNAAIKIQFDSTGNNIQGALFIVGGKKLGKVVAIENAQEHLKSRTLSQLLMDSISTKILQENEGTFNEDTRRTVSSILQEFLIDISNWNQNLDRHSENLDVKRNDSIKKSSQFFQIVPKDQSVIDLIGRPVQHLAAIKSCTGESLFTDDNPPLKNELFCAVVLSEQATGKIVSVDISKALSLPGVVDFIDYKSIPNEENNLYGHLPEENDEFVFRKDVTSCGQIIGLIVANDQLVARKGASLVKVSYDMSGLPPPIFTMEEAMAKKSFHKQLTLQHGDVNQGFANSQRVLEGEIRSGGQKHLYMEVHSARAMPTEDGGVELAVTTQSISDVQRVVAHVLGLPANKVIVTCSKIGGGFGGRESKAAQLAAAVSAAAHKLNKPIRCTLSREEDMKLVGGRHPFWTQYKVGFNLDGRITSIQAKIYSNAGCSLDMSAFIMEACLKCLTLSYKIQNWDLYGAPCWTNLVSNTAFRGFGGPQSCLIWDTILQRVAQSVGKSAEDVRFMHLYEEGDMTPIGFPWENCTNKRCWDECKVMANLDLRMEQIRDFNTKNKFRKRGIAMTTCSQGMGFPVPLMNQGGSLVMIYTDGSVSLNHGGIEMGQGIHTKMVQIASRVLGIPISKIYVAKTATDKVPNTIVSAASMTCDLNGPAVLNACTELMKRLEPIKKANPTGSWEEWIQQAYMARINLSAVGYNKLEFPHMFNYITFGVACSEVEINCLTGEQKMLRTDIVMDIGESLNPAVDIGQVEGGFVQGLGMYVMEETTFSATGEFTSSSTLNYKVPTISDIPQVFNVAFLRGTKNPRAVYSSKAVGEPPLYLGVSVHAAIQHAIKAFRKEHELNTDIFLDAPLTPNEIQKACQI